MQKNIAPVLVVGGISILLVSILVVFMFIPSLNLFGSAVTGGLGSTALSLGQINYITTSGLSTTNAWQAVLSYSGLQNNQLVGSTFNTEPTFLQTLLGQRTRDQITVSSYVNRLSCDYSISLAQTAGAQHYKLDNVNVNLIVGNNNTDVACAGYLSSIFQYQKSYTSGISTGDICATSFIRSCQSSGGTYLINNAAQNWNGISFDGSNRYICSRMSVDTTKPSYIVYQPTSFRPDVNIHYTITNLGTNAREDIDLNPQSPIVTSNDRKVRVQLDGGTTAFNTQCPEYSGWYILLQNTTFAPQAYVVSRSSITPTPVIVEGSTLTAGQTSVNNYNSNVDSLITSTNNYLDQGNTNYNNFRGFEYQLSGNVLSSGSQVSIDRTNLPFLYPRAIITMATDFASVYEPTARPQIQQVVPNPVTLSQNGLQQRVDVYVSNNGDNNASITTTMSCSPSGVNVQGSTGGQTVSNSVPGDFIFYLGGNQGTYSCNVRACSSNLQNCATQSVSVNVRAQCDAGPRPNDNYGLVFNNDGSCRWQCNINSCPTGYILNNCQCIRTSGSACVAPSLRSCETWNPTTCTTSVNSGYTIQGGQCVANQNQTGNLTCQQEVNAIQCGSLDLFCPVNKTIASFNCGAESLVSLSGNLAIIVGVVCGSIIIISIIGGAVIVSGGKRKR